MFAAQKTRHGGVARERIRYERRPGNFGFVAQAIVNDGCFGNWFAHNLFSGC
jgi:hypothetical protein